MALVNCKECDAQVSTKADKCPGCGAKRKRHLSALEAVGGLIFAVVIGLYFFGGGLEQQAAQNMQSITDKVADDSLAVKVR